MYKFLLYPDSLHKLLFVYLLLVCIPSIRAQNIILPEPLWTLSLGDHKYTSSDQLADVKRDSLGNIYALIETERDTTGSDVAILKVSPEGKLLWKCQLTDARLHNKYETPIFLDLVPDGGVYFAGTQYFSISQPFRAVFLGKVNAQGQLAWQRDLDSLLYPHHFYEQCYGYTDTGGNLRVQYSTLVYTENEPIRSTHFLRFSPAGVLLENVNKGRDFLHFLGREPDILYQDHDTKGQYRMLLKTSQFTKRPLAIRRGTAAQDTIVWVNVPDSLQEYANRNGERALVRTDSKGNLYLGLQDAVFNLTPSHLYFLKITPEGQFSLLHHIQRSDTSFLRLSDFTCADDGLYLTGTAVDLHGYGQTFVRKITYAGALVAERVFRYPRELVRPMRLYKYDSTLYLTRLHYGRSALDLVSFDKDLQETRSYRLRTPPFRWVIDDGLLPIGNQRFISTFTTYDLNYPRATQYTENDVHCKLIDLSAPTEVWSYTYNGIGTSMASDHALRSDAQGNIYFLTGHTRGPVAFAVPSPPVRYSLAKYTPLGQLLWKYNFPDTSYINHLSTGHFAVSEAGRVTLVITDKLGVPTLYTLTSPTDVRPLFSHSEIPYVYSAKDGRSMIAVPNGADSLKLLLFDNHMQPLGERTFKGYILRFHEATDPSAIYWLAHEVPFEPRQPSTLRLYRNLDLVWENILLVPPNNAGSLSALAFHPRTSQVFYTMNDGTAGILSKVSLNGDFERVRYVSDTYPLALHLVDDRIILIGKDSMEIWSQDLRYLHTKPRPVYYGEYHISVNDLLYSITDSVVHVFDKNAEEICTYRHPFIHPVQSLLDGGGNRGLVLYTVHWAGNYMAAHLQWRRILLSPIPLTEETVNRNEKPADLSPHLILSPNPVTDRLLVTCPKADCVQYNNIVLVDAMGRTCEVREISHDGQTISLSLSHLPTGVYWTMLQDQKGRWSLIKFLKVNP